MVVKASEKITEKYIPLQVHYKEKEIAKQLGAQWHPALKFWYIPPDCPNRKELLQRFPRYTPKVDLLNQCLCD